MSIAPAERLAPPEVRAIHVVFSCVETSSQRRPESPSSSAAMSPSAALFANRNFVKTPTIFRFFKTT